ncbi:MAG: hypothetical protein LBF89_02185 [Bacteroidales bacterium]|nr:hypothetical protein [Bacteroidales bacterium]
MQADIVRITVQYEQEKGEGAKARKHGWNSPLTDSASIKERTRTVDIDDGQ